MATMTATQPLTDRECAVADAMANGQSYNEIAAGLGISTSTVRTHVRHIYDALGIPSDRGAFLRTYQRSKVPWAAAIMREKTGKLSEATWAALIVMMLDALDDA